MLTNKVHSWTILMLSIVTLSFLGCGKESPTGTENLAEADVSTGITALAENARADNTNIDSFDMVDAFSGSGAQGSGHAAITNGGGGVIDLTIHASRLEADHLFEVHLTVGLPDEPEFSLKRLTIHKFPVMSDKNGKFEFRLVGFALNLDPAMYRLDYVVVDDELKKQPKFPKNLVLACAPASFVTIG